MTTPPPIQTRERGNGTLEWLRQRQSQGRPTFTSAEAMDELKRTPLAVTKALRRLVRRGILAVPRRGFYVIVPGDYHAAGAPPASWFIDDLMRYLDQPYYVGLLTAAAQHGSSHQAAQVFQVVTDRPTRPITAGRNRIAFVMKSGIERTPTARVKTPTGYMTVSTPESTALDLVRYHKSAGHLNHVATVLEELAEQVNGEVLSRTALASDCELVVAQRLGYLLEHVGAADKAVGLASLVADKAPQTVPLRADRPRKGFPVNARWRLTVNTQVEPDL